MRALGTAFLSLLVSALWWVPAVSAEPPVGNIEAAVTALSTEGAWSGLSSQARHPFLAVTEGGAEEWVFAGSSPLFGPVIFDQQGNVTGYKLMLYQDMQLHLEPKHGAEPVVQVADGILRDVDRVASHGPVPIPADYVYDPSLPHSGYHDYCTMSPSYFTTTEINADFRGACARHDMCMEAADARGEGYLKCNVDLLTDMSSVCSAVYTGEYASYLPRCLNTARLYHASVNIAHLDNLL